MSTTAETEGEEKKIDLANYVVKKFLRMGANDVVVSATSQETTQIKFANSEISTTQTWQSEKMHLFIAVNKRLVSTSLRSFTKQAADETVDKLMAFAAATEPNKEYEGIAEGPFTYSQIKDVYDKAVEELGEKAVDITESAIQTAMQNGAKRTAGVFETATYQTYLLTSNKAEAFDKGTKLYLSLRALIDKFASGHYVCNSRMLRHFKHEQTAEKAAEIAKRAEGPKNISEGIYDIIFYPLPLANLLNQVGQASSIFNVESKLSCLAEKLGKGVANKNVSLIDDGTLPNGFGTTKFDEEGVPTRRNIIIKEGVLQTYLHNTSSAKRHGTKTTANAGLITPEPFNIILQQGNSTEQEMVEQVKKGLIVTNVWYTRFQNYESGDFSTIPRDGIFLVQNGKITGAVKEMRISDNLLRLMQHITAIGKEQESVFGWEAEIPTITPAVLIRNVNVSGSVE